MSTPTTAALSRATARRPADHNAYTFTDKYPALSDLLQHGGLPGVRYALVAAQRIGHYQSRIGYDLVSRLPAITIEITDGLHAGSHAAMLMCNGAPIPCAQPGGSVRIYDIDPYLDEATGLGPVQAAGASRKAAAAATTK